MSSADDNDTFALAHDVIKLRCGGGSSVLMIHAIVN